MSDKSEQIMVLCPAGCGCKVPQSVIDAVLAERSGSRVRTDHRTKMDWGQVVMNGGPPCFYDNKSGWYCGRAERWAGHPSVHAFIPLETLVAEAMLARIRGEMLISAENELTEIRNCDKCDLCEDHHD